MFALAIRLTQGIKVGHMNHVATLALTLAAMTPDARDKAELVILTHAIAQVESGGDYKAVGDHGKALGAWQMHVAAWIMANAWRDKQGLPKIRRTEWQVPDNQRNIAIAYVSWCKEQVVAHGIKPTTEHVYLAFAMGPTAFKDCGGTLAGAPKAKADAATRVANIFAELTK